jgi:hypothetical protein
MAAVHIDDASLWAQGRAERRARRAFAAAARRLVRTARQALRVREQQEQGPTITRYVLLGPPMRYVLDSEETVVHLAARTRKGARAEARRVCRESKWAPWLATLLDGRTGEKVVGFHVLSAQEDGR